MLPINWLFCSHFLISIAIFFSLLTHRAWKQRERKNVFFSWSEEKEESGVFGHELFT
jgi:hypothetical protein